MQDKINKIDCNARTIIVVLFKIPVHTLFRFPISKEKREMADRQRKNKLAKKNDIARFIISVAIFSFFF